VPDRYRLYATPARLDDEQAAAARLDRRRPIFGVAAWVFAPELSKPLACTVHDLSETGARFELDRERLRSHEPAPELPSNFTVYFGPDHSEVSCRLAWRDGRHFGVQFLEPPHESDRQAPLS